MITWIPLWSSVEPPHSKVRWLYIQVTLEWEDYPGLSGWAQCNQKDSYEWNRKAGKPESEWYSIKKKIYWPLLIFVCGHKPRNAGSSRSLKKKKRQRKRSSPESPPRKADFLWHLGFNIVTPIEDFWTLELYDAESGLFSATVGNLL